MLLLSDGRTRLDISLTAPAGWDTGDDPIEISLADTWTAALIDTCGQINKPDYNLTAGDSATVPDQPLCEEGEGNALGASTFTGSLTVLRQMQPDGQVLTADDTVYTAIGEKGVMAYYVERTGPKAKVELAVGDQGWIYQAESDEPKSPGDRAGYIKEVIRLAVKGRRRFTVVA